LWGVFFLIFIKTTKKNIQISSNTDCKLCQLGCERVAKGLRKGCAEVAPRLRSVWVLLSGFWVKAYFLYFWEGFAPLSLESQSETPTEVQRELLSRERVHTLGFLNGKKERQKTRSPTEVRLRSVL
jgi:hypothetical protein